MVFLLPIHVNFIALSCQPPSNKTSSATLGHFTMNQVFRGDVSRLEEYIVSHLKYEICES